MGKNKNKNKGGKQNPPQQTVTKPSVPVLTEDQKEEIAVLNENTSKRMDEAQVEPNEALSSESESKLKDAELKEDIVKYWTYVKDINKRLETLVNRMEEERGKVSTLKEELEKSKKDSDAVKYEYEKKLESCNKKDKELTEREFALDNSEYTGIIKKLLDTLKDTERKVFTDTENLLKELSDFHKRNLEEFSAYQKESAEFEKQQSNLKKEQKKFEINKTIFKEELREEYENKFSEELNRKTEEMERLSRKFDTLNNENEKLKQFSEDIRNAFEDAEPKEMLKRHTRLREERDNLKTELNERPEKSDFDAKQAQIEELHAKIAEYKEKVNEGELLELKRILSNQDSYIIEINGYKNQIESAKVREGSLKKTIGDLQITINQLKGESAKNEDAFEYAKKIDADTLNIGVNRLDTKNHPNNLKELVEYVQQKMAFHPDKPFYYSLDTIRIFLAGLHMSPISILQGISGTGKTSLPCEFAKALISDASYIEINSDDNTINAPYRICAVQSGWRDNMDLMGYYNSFEHKYKETDFFKALYLANQPKYIDTLFFIILDEMNLSRPEHYFADFLSLLEQSADEKYININAPEEVLPQLVKGGKLKVPANVRFIGTANHDETTLEFAPKTYDRSNVLEMPKNYIEVKQQENTEQFNISYSWLNEQFNKAESNNKTHFESFKGFIDSDKIKKEFAEKGIGSGNRLEDQAKRFISVFVESGGEVHAAIDHLVTSRLFRVLKNRYDLDKNNLVSFKDGYLKLFKASFKDKNPVFAQELLTAEISKK
jgi:hypothetical protein